MVRLLWIVIALLGLVLAGCPGHLAVGDRPDDDDVDDDDASDDDDVTDDDDDNGEIPPELQCGPHPDLTSGEPSYTLYTADIDVEVNANWQDHWRWAGCYAGYVVLEDGELYCGAIWDLVGASSSENPQDSSYEMEIQAELVLDTCDQVGDFNQSLRVTDIGGNWDLFRVEFYDGFTMAWHELDPAAQGEVWWDGGGTSGEGWLEINSTPQGYSP